MFSKELNWFTRIHPYILLVVGEIGSRFSQLLLNRHRVVASSALMTAHRLIMLHLSVIAQFLILQKQNKNKNNKF